jgi:uncharacterized protein YueI
MHSPVQRGAICNGLAALLFLSGMNLQIGVFKMKSLTHDATADHEELFLTHAPCAPAVLPSVLGREVSDQLTRMFRDPRVLNPDERRSLISHLREAVDLAPHVAEVRVVLGMALCVDLQVQEALEELRESVRLAPDSFIARLKFGELLMRLRICSQAAEETHQAALLASNSLQSDLARRQAATLRTMLREGIERGGYGGLISRFLRFRGKTAQQTQSPLLVDSK